MLQLAKFFLGLGQFFQVAGFPTRPSGSLAQVSAEADWKSGPAGSKYAPRNMGFFFSTGGDRRGGGQNTNTGLEKACATTGCLILTCGRGSLSERTFARSRREDLSM